MKSMTTRLCCICVLLPALVLAAFFITAPVPAAASSEAIEAQGLVDKAHATFNDFMADKNYTWLHQNLKNARAILIYPQVLKAGFFLGGSGGNGVLVVKDKKTGTWSQPAFYTIGSVSFGLQIGGEAAEVVMLVMSNKAVDSLYASSLKLGGDTSIALGPVGAGAKGNVTADFISFAKTQGIYAGLNLEGSIIAVRDKLNQAYYGKNVRPVEIVVEKKVANSGTAALRTSVRKATK